MYGDLSVTVSAPIVRDMEKAFAVLKMVSMVNGVATELSPDHAKVMQSARNTLEKLFLWEEDLLGEQTEFQILLCRKLGWYTEIIETISCIVVETEDFLADIYSTLVDVSAGKKVNGDDYDEMTEFFFLASETIWDYFIQIHLEISKN